MTDLVEKVTDKIQAYMGDEMFIGLRRKPARAFAEAIIPLVLSEAAAVARKEAADWKIAGVDGHTLLTGEWATANRIADAIQRLAEGRG